MLDVPMINAPLSVTLTLFAPVLLSDTAPVKTFDCVKVMGLALALKLDVPGTVNMPVCVMAPLVVTPKFPLVVNVVVGSETPAFVKLIVRLVFVPVIAPPKTNVPVPVPPIVVLVCNTIGLFNVSLLPVMVNAPAPPMPVPLRFIVFAFVKVPLLKERSNAAPDDTVVLVVLPNAPILPRLNSPAVIVVAPL